MYTQTLLDTDDNLYKCVIILGSYILGIFSQRTHRKLAMMEVWNDQQFSQYKTYLMMIVKDPMYSGISPIPYSATADNPLADFQSDWNKNFYNGTASQQLALSAELSPNDGSRLGPYAYSGAY